jgi:hypothetical protein
MVTLSSLPGLAVAVLIPNHGSGASATSRTPAHRAALVLRLMVMTDPSLNRAGLTSRSPWSLGDEPAVTE